MRTTALATLSALLFAAAAVAAAPDFSAADRAIEAGIARHDAPGAVLLVGKGDEIVYARAYGNRSLLPTTQPMTVDTIFDYASLTKPIATATSVLILADRGKIDLDAPVARYLPSFAASGKDAITVEQLLLHRSGLLPDNPMSDFDGTTHDQALERIFASKPTTQPGAKFVYSDLNFITLGELVHRVDGRTLDKFAHDEVFDPLGMNDTGFLPSPNLKDRIAPTEKRKGEWMIGDVHDPRAWALGGVAGHAGVFGTAADLSRWIRMINHGGELNGVRILSESMVRRMLTKNALPDGSGARGLGVDIDSSFSSNRGSRFSRDLGFGHTGWTGTSFWSDRPSGVFVILFTNRVHPDGTGDVKKMRSEVATAVAEAMLGPATEPTTRP